MSKVAIPARIRPMTIDAAPSARDLERLANLLH